MDKSLKSEIENHFNNPQNVGEIKAPDGVGQSGSTACRNLIKFTARIEKNIIKDIKFKAFGCSYTIASASFLTSITRSKDILKSTLISEDMLEKKFGKFPPQKKEVLGVAIDALQKLITCYISKPHTVNIYKTCSNRIAVALSGGVDSSMAAKLLKEEGWDIVGITMKFLPEDFRWEKASKTCCSPQDIQAARKVSLNLNIPHVVVDLAEPFKQKVIELFCQSYFDGKTPNPCIECNKYIKFGILLDKAKNLGAKFLATGHYCQIEKSPITNKFIAKKALDRNKDQSYVFWKLNQNQLSHIKTPLGKFSKDEIKIKANKLFPLFLKKGESQEVCFIAEDKYHHFLLKRFGKIGEGKIVNAAGKTIGTHKGYLFYTIGQRKGLGISCKRPLYVKEIIPKKNIIVACEEEDLYHKKIMVNELNFILGFPPSEKFRALVKIRYKSKESPAEIRIIDENSALVSFSKPQRAITPGQSAVFYDGNILLGGGVIIKSDN